MVKLVTDVGRLQETVAIWIPATWLKTTRALRPLAKQRSYSAVKSAVVTAGVGQTGPGHSSTRATSNHARPRDSGGD